jgi:23S rRNA pseudouridine2605 synthase
VPQSDSAGERLQAYLARAGVASRRACEKIIACGRVSLNGEIVTRPGVKAFPGDRVLLDGGEITLETTLHYLAMNKPALYLCSNKDPENRPLARFLLPPALGERLYTVGRLDYRSCGLLLWTNDGPFAAALAHPSSGVEKEYLVETTTPVPGALLEAFLAGVVVEGVEYRCLEIEKISRKAVRVTLIEGKNREIRRVFSHFHLSPSHLCRVRIGALRLDGLAEGKTRPLTPQELSALLPPSTRR